MRLIRVLCVIGVGVFGASTSAEAANIISVIDTNSKTVTTTGPRGTATTQFSRNGNTVTATTTIRPNGSYQPMGGGSYRPMGGSTYSPMGH